MRNQRGKARDKSAKLRVKKEPPTLEEAMFAAAGLTDDLDQQIEIAATLMGLPLEADAVKALKAARPRAKVVDMTSARGKVGRAVLVERKRAPRSFSRPAQAAGSRA